MKKTFTLLTCLLLLFNQISFSQAGSLDTSFGPNKSGRFTEEPFAGNYAGAYAMAVQKDGKIILAGFADVPYKTSYLREILLLKYNSNGLRDSSFGTNGMVVTSVSNKSATAHRVVLQKDNKIVVLAGSEGTAVLIRYKTTGKVDSTFGVNGIVYTPTDQVLTIQPNGKIIVGGITTMIRYKNDGSLDSNFGTNGNVSVPSGVNAVMVKPDGTIFTAGGGFSVAQYTEKGKLHKSFGNNGVATGRFSATSHDYCTNAVLQPDGKIVLVGSTDEGEGKYDDYAIIRFLANGKVDSSFGTNGTVSAEFKYHWREYANAVALQANGKIVVTGSCHTGGSNIAGIARYFGGDGRLDTVFGGTGKVLGDYDEYNQYYDSEGNAIAIEPDGKILVAGIEGVTAFSTANVGVARYNNTSNFVNTLPAITNSNLKKSNITISPNPVKDILYIRGLSANTNHVVSVFNGDGKQVLTAATQSTNYSFNVNRLTPGLYYVKIDGANNTSLKFVKE